MPAKPKLCFVLPECSEKTHFRYVAEFANALQEHAEVFLVQEKGDDTLHPRFPEHFYRQRMRMGLLRFKENFLVLLRARMRGYRTFYVHYSFVAAVNAGLVTKLFGGTVYYWNCGMPWQYARTRRREWFERVAYRLIDHLVTGAPSLVPEYARYYGLDPKSVIVIPNWIEPVAPVTDAVRALVLRDIAAPKGTCVLLYVHRLARRKGAHHLPALAAALAEERVVLAVIGDGPERGAIERDCAERGVGDRVRFLGERNKDYVDAAFQCADIFVMPSEEEGSPHALLEAMAAGLPFVAFDVGGVRDTAPKNCEAYVVAANDVSLFAQTVRTLLHDRVAYRRFQEEEATWVKNFSLKRTVARFCEQVLGVRP